MQSLSSAQSSIPLVVGQPAAAAISSSSAQAGIQQSAKVLAASWGSRLLGYPGERISVMMAANQGIMGRLSLRTAFHGVLPATTLSGARAWVATIGAGQLREGIPRDMPMRDAMTGVACALFNSALQPVNVWKTRHQSAETGTSMLSVVRTTPPRDLYAGTVSVLGRNTIWQAVNAQVYGAMRCDGDSYVQKTGKQLVASTAASLASYPLQVVAVIQSNEGMGGSSVWSALVTRARQSGVRGLYAGVSPALARVWVCSLVLAPVTDYLTKK